MANPESPAQAAEPKECAFSKRADGKHGWRFDGDDPYVVCHFCSETRDALTDRVIRPTPDKPDAQPPTPEPDWKALYERERALTDELAVAAKDDSSFYARMDLVHQDQHEHCRCDNCRTNRRNAALARCNAAREATR